MMLPLLNSVNPFDTTPLPPGRCVGPLDTISLVLWMPLSSWTLLLSTSRPRGYFYCPPPVLVSLSIVPLPILCATISPHGNLTTCSYAQTSYVLPSPLLQFAWLNLLN
ncbi:uncharacterized protein UHOD_11645 [Ustilago sp. UG-2017b]|nr:uncharacterized protein UHOD_11645 [Ustilago sp. UG-2017b]